MILTKSIYVHDLPSYYLKRSCLRNVNYMSIILGEKPKETALDEEVIRGDIFQHFTGDINNFIVRSI